MRIRIAPSLGGALGLVVCVLLSCSSGSHDASPVTVSSSVSAPASHGFAPAGGASFAGAAGTCLAAVDASGALHVTTRRGQAAGPAASSLRLETLAVARSPLASATPGPSGTRAPVAPHARLGDDGVVAIDRGVAVEHIEARAHGVEQSWTFAAAPAGTGDLVVRVRAGGLRFAGASKEGLAFADGSGGFVYGTATWVDAAGRRSTVDATFANGAVAIDVPSKLVDTAAYPATLNPTISPEFPLEDPIYVPATSVGAPSIASDGTNYLVTWSTGYDIYAARVSGAGAVLDPTPTIVANEGTNDDSSKTKPRAVWTGSEWFVVWADTSENGVDGIFAQRVASDGTVVGPQVSDQGYTVSSAILASSLDVAFDGIDVFVVYDAEDEFAVPHVYGVRMSPTGTAIDTTPITISNAAYPKQQKNPRVAFDGTEFFVAWADARTSTSVSSPSWDIYGARITHAGQLLDGPTDTGGTPIATATGNQIDPSVTSSGSVAFVTWTDSRGASPAYYGARVDPSLGLVDGPAASGGVLLGSAGESFNPTAAAFDGQEFVTAWSNATGQYGDVDAVRVSTAGALLGAPGSQVLAVTSATLVNGAPAIAGASGGAFIGWMDERLPKGAEIFGTRIDATGALLDGTAAARGLLVSEQPSERYDAAVASSGSGFLAAWVDNRDSASQYPEIFATRVDTSGTPLDAPAFAVATGRPTYSANVSVGSSGSAYVVTWTETSASGTALQARFLDANGNLLNGPASSAPITLSATGGGFPAAIAWDGTDYLFAWSDSRQAPNEFIYGVRTSSTGAVAAVSGSTDGSFPIVTGSGSGSAPFLDFDGTNFMILWLSAQGASTVEASRLGPDGSRLDGTAATAGVIVLANSQNGADAAGLAFDGTNHVALMTSGSAVVSAAISTAGQVTASSLSQSGISPSLAYDGRAFWAFWYSYASGGTVGARLRGDGSLRDTAPFTICPYSIGNPTQAAGNTTGEALALCYPSTVQDARGVLITDDAADGVACASGATCATGVCEDGVCCDRPCGGSTPDCESCSVAAGAARDGVCGVSAAATICRPVAGACDLAEACDGVATTCPADRFVKVGTTCALDTECASGATCNGTSAACATTAVASGTACDGGTCEVGACVVAHEAGGGSGAIEAGVADASTSAPEDASAEGAATAITDATTTGIADATATTSDAGVPGTSLPEDAEAQGDAEGTAPDASAPGDTSSSGCSCRTAVGSSRAPACWGLAALGVVAARRHRRRILRRGPAGGRADGPARGRPLTSERSQAPPGMSNPGRRR